MFPLPVLPPAMPLAFPLLDIPPPEPPLDIPLPEPPLVPPMLPPVPALCAISNR
jgi:hypothetical protein